MCENLEEIMACYYDFALYFAVRTDSAWDVLYILGVYQEVKALLVLWSG